MALRFRTRLTLSISFLVFLTVSVMTLGFIWILVQNLGSQYEEMGVTLNQLANRNISYGVTLPARVTERVEAQMVVNALLASELVAFAEKPQAAAPGEVNAALKRVIERSRQIYGVPLIDEFWITDEAGRAYINTEGIEYTFPRDHEQGGQAAEFRKLLEVGAPPIIQDLQERSLDGEPYKYVGVSGVDQPRIVQVGVSEYLMELAISDFEIQDFIERFNEGEEGPLFRRVAVVNGAGEIVASVGPEGASNLGPSNVTRVIQRECQNYLASTDTESAHFLSMEGDLGVVTPLSQSRGGEPLALFIQHPVKEGVSAILRRVGLVAIIGSGMIILGFLVSVLMSRGFSKPIVALSRGAREFGAGNLNYRLYWKRKDEFQGLAQAFNTMAISLQEYMHELELETTRRERLESELRIASQMQQDLWPETPPHVAGLELFGWSKPSKEVGGDSFDYIPLGDGKVAVVIGDATGKGISAALLITQCWSVLHTLSTELHGPAELLERTNVEFYKRVGTTHKFVTLFVAVIDVPNAEAVFASAGHPPPVLVNSKTGQSRWLEPKPSFPLGIVPDADFHEGHIALTPGDTLVLFSDGLSDAHAPDNALYGEKRIEQTLTRFAGRPLRDVIDALYADAVKHMGGRDPIDDMTVVAARYLGMPDSEKEFAEALEIPQEEVTASGRV